MLIGFRPLRLLVEGMNRRSNISRALAVNPGTSVYLDEQRVYARNLEVPAGGGVGTAETIIGKWLKERPRDQFIYLFPDLPSIETLADVDAVSLRGLERMLGAIRAPMTMVFPSHDEDGSTTVAVRVMTHPFLRAVLRSCNPVASSSANKHGTPPPESLRDVSGVARDAADIEVRTPLPSAGIPSAVVDFSVRPVTIRRPGQLQEQELRSALKVYDVLR